MEAMQVELYQSVLKKLSLLPVDSLPLVDNYLSTLAEKNGRKEQNRKAIFELVGSWKDMSDDDFQEYLRVAKETGKEMFNRQVEL